MSHEKLNLGKFILSNSDTVFICRCRLFGKVGGLANTLANILANILANTLDNTNSLNIDQTYIPGKRLHTLLYFVESHMLFDYYSSPYECLLNLKMYRYYFILRSLNNVHVI